MRTRSFEFRAQGVRGLPAVLLIILGLVAVVGVVALLLFVGVAVAAAALVLSAGLALWQGVRRKLNLSGSGASPLGSQHEPRPFFEEVPAQVGKPSSTLTEAREIEVEVLPAKER